MINTFSIITQLCGHVTCCSTLFGDPLSFLLLWERNICRIFAIIYYYYYYYYYYIRVQYYGKGKIMPCLKTSRGSWYTKNKTLTSMLKDNYLQRL